MWTSENRPKYNRDKLRYPSALTDDEWSHIEPLIPPAKRGGRKRAVDPREIVNGVMYVLSTGCQWRYVPKDLPPKSTLFGYFDLWNWDGTLDRIHPAVNVKCREAMDREASPAACVIDTQSVKSAEKGGTASIRAATMRARRERTARLAHVVRPRRRFDPPRAQTLCDAGLRDRSRQHCVRARQHDDQFVPFVFSVGGFSFDQGGGQNAHASRSGRSPVLSMFPLAKWATPARST